MKQNRKSSIVVGILSFFICLSVVFLSAPKQINATTITVQEAADITVEWKNFRNSDVNMAITNVALPTSKEKSSRKWDLQLGADYRNAINTPLLLDDAVVTISGTTIYKANKETGEVIQSGELVEKNGYGYTPMTYAEGMIFCPLSGGTIQAVNAKTLESVWVYRDEKRGQALSPITYSDGYIYTGFWNGERNEANFVCIAVADEELQNSQEEKAAIWSYTKAGGYYWAGSVVIGDAVIVGSDDGASGADGQARLYAFQKQTGAVISELPIQGDQRSSIAYDQSSGRIYFTTKSGYLYSAAVDASGVLSDLKGVNYAYQITSTPVVYDGKVYFTCGNGMSSFGTTGGFVVADAQSLQKLYQKELLAYSQCSLLLSTAYEERGILCFYATYNGLPGGITFIKVAKDGTTEDSANVIELFDAKGKEQYCACSLICDSSGTIYYKNDSGTIFAVGKVEDAPEPEKPTTEEPTTKEPTEEPVSEEPTSEEPMSEEPTTELKEEPTTGAPLEPATDSVIKEEPSSVEKEQGEPKGRTSDLWQEQREEKKKKDTVDGTQSDDREQEEQASKEEAPLVTGPPLSAEAPKTISWIWVGGMAAGALILGIALIVRKRKS